MRCNLYQRSLICGLTLPALLAFCVLQPIVTAEPIGVTDTNVVIVQSAPIGLARGQSLRVTGLNPGESGSRAPDGRSYKMLVAVLIVDGSRAAQSDEFVIEPGEFHSFDFDRDDLPLAGEPGTGRVQLCALVRYRFFSLIDRTQLPPASLEIIDTGTGRTTAAHSQKPKEIVVVGAKLSDPFVFAGDIRSSGMAHGQTIRFSLFNPSDPSQAPGGEPVHAQVRLFDTGGREIAQSPAVAIPAGEFRSIDFNRDDLPLTGEPGTGRVQIKGTWTMTVQDAAAQDREFPASLEIVENVTGASSGGFVTLIKLRRDAGGF